MIFKKKPRPKEQRLGSRAKNTYTSLRDSMPKRQKIREEIQFLRQADWRNAPTRMWVYMGGVTLLFAVALWLVLR